MIMSFRHKGLDELFVKNRTKRIDSRYWDKILEQLNYLDVMEFESDINDMRQWYPHRLVGKNPHGQDIDGHWSLKVNGNWRITYYFNDEDGNVYLVKTSPTP